MASTNRRELLGMALGAVVATRVFAAEPELRAGLSAAERDAIEWGDAAFGLQAGLRLLHPARGYRLGDQIETAAYIRNRTAAPIRFLYYPAFYEHTPTVIGPDGKAVLVEGYSLAGWPTVILVNLPAAETLLVEHPGLWIMQDRSADRKSPSIADPQPGRYLISQNVQLLVNPAERKPIRDRGKEMAYPLTFFSEAGKPHHSEAQVLMMLQGDGDHSITTGALDVTVRG